MKINKYVLITFMVGVIIGVLGVSVVVQTTVPPVEVPVYVGRVVEKVIEVEVPAGELGCLYGAFLIDDVQSPFLIPYVEGIGPAPDELVGMYLCGYDLGYKEEMSKDAVLSNAQIFVDFN